MTDLNESYSQRIKELEKEIAISQQKTEFLQVNFYELQQQTQERSRSAESVLKAMELKLEESNSVKEQLEIELRSQKQ